HLCRAGPQALGGCAELRGTLRRHVRGGRRKRQGGLRRSAPPRRDQFYACQRGRCLVRKAKAANKLIEKASSSVAAAMMVGLIWSRIPENIWTGSVRCSAAVMNSATTTSSKEMAKAKIAPET